MKKRIPQLIVGVVVFGFVAMLVAPAQANAEETGTKNAAQTEEKRQQLEQKQLEEQKKQASLQQQKETAAAQANKEKHIQQKRQVCEKHQKKITGAMARISNRGQNQLEVFTKIAERVQKFYVDKGKTLENYDVLVADVNIKKAAAAVALETIKASPQNFSCDSENPKESTQTFKQNHKTANEALKAYKTAVKNLIVGVKSVQGTVSRENGGGDEQ